MDTGGYGRCNCGTAWERPETAVPAMVRGRSVAGGAADGGNQGKVARGITLEV